MNKPNLPYNTPVEALAGVGRRLRVDLRIKRDDVLPLAGGGNKVRKGERIIEEIERVGANAIVTNGGIQSNHARVMALLAARKGWRCALVLHAAKAGMEKLEGNLLLMKLAGADISVCAPSEVAGRLTAASEHLRRTGHEPYLVPGGGHSLPGALAFVDAVRETALQLGDWVPDWIVVPSGTGATQAGIVAGCIRMGWSSRVLGISVARANPRGANAVKEMCEQLEGHFRTPKAFASRVDFRDEWTCGGYERADASVLEVIRVVAREDGVVLDPTYTGKAFAALEELTDRGEIPIGSRVLFWHTGGLLNLMTSPYASDLGLK